MTQGGKSGGGAKWAILALIAGSPILIMFIVSMILILIIGVSVSVVTGVTAGMSGTDEALGGGDGCYVEGGTPTTADQREHVRTMIGIAKTMGIPEEGMVIATMVMLQETGIQNIANDGVLGGEDAAAANWPEPGRDFWLDVAAKSLQFPHDKWNGQEAATDSDSVGLFQQRASMGWADSGSSTARKDPEAAIKRLLDPRWSAQAFFGGDQSPPSNRGLQDVPGWQDLPLTEAAQEVQGSAFPSAYADDEPKARQLVAQNKDAPKQPLIDAGSPPDTDDGDDSDDGGSAKFTYPLEEGSYDLTSDFGPREDPINGGSSFHGGQDFGAAEGTPIHAIADGTVSASGFVGGGFGYWVVIDHEIDGRKYSSVYGHILPDGIIADGSTVSAGDVVAKVGNEGNRTTGFHLHLEIWDGGRFDGGQHVDPMPLLEGGPLPGDNGDCGDSSVIASGTAAAMLEAGEEYVGTPYSWGGGGAAANGPSEGFDSGEGVVGFDCSGLVQYMVYAGTGGKNGGYILPRTAQTQYDATASNPVKKEDLQPGDLMFWGTRHSIHHVAMYWGNGKMIEAPRTGLTVRVTEARTDGDYFGATRLELDNDEESGS